MAVGLVRQRPCVPTAGRRAAAAMWPPSADLGTPTSIASSMVTLGEGFAHAEDYRVEYNTVRPHEALAWNRPKDVHLGQADPLIPSFPETEDLPAA